MVQEGKLGPSLERTMGGSGRMLFQSLDGANVGVTHLGAHWHTSAPFLVEFETYLCPQSSFLHWHCIDDVEYLVQIVEHGHVAPPAACYRYKAPSDERKDPVGDSRNDALVGPVTF